MWVQCQIEKFRFGLIKIDHSSTAVHGPDSRALHHPPLKREAVREDFPKIWVLKSEDRIRDRITDVFPNPRSSSTTSSSTSSTISSTYFAMDRCAPIDVSPPQSVVSDRVGDRDNIPRTDDDDNAPALARMDVRCNGVYLNGKQFPAPYLFDEADYIDDPVLYGSAPWFDRVRNDNHHTNEIRKVIGQKP